MKKVGLLVAIMLAACAPQEQAFQPPSQAPSIGKGAFIASDGASLPLRQWLPSGKPKAVVIALHGFNDYSNAFEGAGTYFKKRRIATYAYDQRGFGRSPQTGLWAGEENLKRDVRDMAMVLADKYPGTPLFLMGESMGGAVVMLADAEQSMPVSGIVLVSPAVWGDEHMPVLYRVLLWGMAHTTPQYKMTGKGLKIMASNNLPMLKAMGADPLVIKATRVDAIYGLSHLMDDAYNVGPGVNNRCLMLYGLKDQVIPRAPIDATKARLAPPSETIYYDDGYHMLTRDLQGEAVLSDIAGWMLGAK